MVQLSDSAAHHSMPYNAPAIARGVTEATACRVQKQIVVGLEERSQSGRTLGERHLLARDDPCQCLAISNHKQVRDHWATLLRRQAAPVRRETPWRVLPGNHGRA